MKWVTVSTAPDQLQAEMWQALLREERIPAVVRSGDTASFLGVSAYPCRVMVQEDNLKRAKEILDEWLGGEEDGEDVGC